VTDANGSAGLFVPYSDWSGRLAAPKGWLIEAEGHSAKVVGQVPKFEANVTIPMPAAPTVSSPSGALPVVALALALAMAKRRR
jgi:hypothetical protein